MRCSRCGTDNPSDRKFCGECGARFSLRCPKCGKENEPPFRFCGDCGGPLLGSPPATRPAGSDRAPRSVRIAAETSGELEGERKTVTALFADIKGSTELMEDIDPEEARRIVDPALKLMIEAAHRYDGYIVQSTGDGIFALFGAPVAHEDHPQRALYGALRMQEELRRYSAKLVADGGMPIEARIGATTGEVVVRSIATGAGHAEYTPIGHTANLASRMQAVAPTGSIAISEATRKLVEGYFALKQLGPTKVKGISEPVNVYEVTGLGPIRTRLQRAAGRGYTKFVGRQREMDAMKHAAEQAKVGHGQIVAAIADAGVGKSRLFFEFKATSQSGWLVLDALSLSHDKATAYVPLIDLLHVYFRITPDDDARTRREKVAGKIAMLDRSLEQETLPHLFALLGIVEGENLLAQTDAQVRRRRTQDAVKRILLRESLNQPLMLIFEDLHWIDEETQAFLNLLVEGMANAPVLLLVNYRPEYTHQWGSKTYYTQLRLDPLGKESAEEMLSALLGDGAELAPLKRMIVEKTEGNPLFMEEIFQSLVEDGSLRRNGSVKLIRPVEQLRIPPTVQGILAARIDHLRPEEKDLLQTLAVIGTEFELSLVHHVVQLQPDQLDRLLSGLQTGEFIYEQPAAGDVEYSFKHALTRQVADESLLTERRKLLHERTAQAIEALYHEQLEDHYSDLAHHYRSSNNAAKAVEYLRLAGEQAARRGAYAQALVNVEPALELIKALSEGPERLRAELGVRLMEGMCAPALYGIGSEERLRVFQRVCELGERLGDAPALIRGTLNVAAVYSNRGEISRSLEIYRQALELADTSTSQELLPIVHFMLAFGLRLSGNPIQASSLLKDLMTDLRSAHGVADLLPLNTWALIPMLHALVSHAVGRPDEALRLDEEALRRLRQIKHPFTSVVRFGHSAALRHYRREPEAARSLAEAEIVLAEEHGFRDWLAQARSLRGWALAELGQPEQGLNELEAVAASVPGSFQMQIVGIRAQVYIRLGRGDRALELLDEALSNGERSGAHVEDAELHRLKGEGILMRDSSATIKAQACFRKAIEIARGQSAKWWELRATVSLARLLRDTNRREKARAMLAEIYNWFTEGFDTADLKEAKALLEELNA